MIRILITRYGSARLLRDYHLASTIFWIVMVPISMVTGWWHSIDYVTVISLWALVSTEASAYQASRAEVLVEAMTPATPSTPPTPTETSPESPP